MSKRSKIIEEEEEELRDILNPRANGSDINFVKREETKSIKEDENERSEKRTSFVEKRSKSGNRETFQTTRKASSIIERKSNRGFSFESDGMNREKSKRYSRRRNIDDGRPNSYYSKTSEESVIEEEGKRSVRKTIKTFEEGKSVGDDSLEWQRRQKKPKKAVKTKELQVEERLTEELDLDGTKMFQQLTLDVRRGGIEMKVKVTAKYEEHEAGDVFMAMRDLHDACNRYQRLKPVAVPGENAAISKPAGGRKGGEKSEKNFNFKTKRGPITIDVEVIGHYEEQEAEDLHQTICYLVDACKDPKKPEVIVKQKKRGCFGGYKKSKPKQP